MNVSNQPNQNPSPVSRGSKAGSIHAEHGANVRAGQGRKFHGTLNGNFRGVATQEIPALALNTNEWNKIAADAINEYCAEENLETKEVAQRIGVNDRTMENYRQARCAPSGIQMLRCIAMIPQFASAVDRLTAMERDMDPMTEKARTDLLLAAAKFLDAKGVSA